LEEVIRREGIGCECIAAVGVTCTSRESGATLQPRTASTLAIEERKDSKPRAQIPRIRFYEDCFFKGWPSWRYVDGMGLAAGAELQVQVRAVAPRRVARAGA